MKMIKNLLAVLALCALAFTTSAADPAPSFTFSLTSTDIGATNSHAIISANSAGIAQVDYVSVTSDKAASKLMYYTAGDAVLITTGTNASQAIVYAVGTGNFAANDIVVLRHYSTDTYERLVVSAVAATTVTFTGNPTAATVAGDRIYKMTAGATVPVAAATVSIVGPSYFGQKSKPIYVEIDGTSASQINAIAGRFVTYK